MKCAIVTGASSGMGEEFVKQIANYNQIEEIWVIARREQKLQELQQKIHKPIRVIAMDITLEESRKQLEELLLEQKPQIKFLVNCAGYGIRKNFTEATLEEQIGMLKVNCESMTVFTYQCIPYMQRNSRIIQMASAAAFLPQAGFAVYSASKAYVLSFSKALYKELKPRQIYVTAVCPGPVDTEFFEISDAGGAMPAYKKFFLAKSDKVVTKALKDSINKKSSSIYGSSIKLLQIFAKIFR